NTDLKVTPSTSETVEGTYELSDGTLSLVFESGGKMMRFAMPFVIRSGVLLAPAARRAGHGGNRPAYATYEEQVGHDPCEDTAARDRASAVTCLDDRFSYELHEDGTAVVKSPRKTRSA